MSETSDLALIGTGIGFGIVHVFTGPDHLSAIATLTSNVSECKTAFYLGIRWGIGHSTGLLSVGTILIILDLSNAAKYGTDDPMEVPAWLQQVGEYIVGLFMIFLGLYGIWKATIKRREIRRTQEIEDEEAATLRDAEDGDAVSDTMTEFRDIDQEEEDPEGTSEEDQNQQPESTFTDMFHSHSHGHMHSSSLEIDDGDATETSCFLRCTRNLSAKTLAFFAGIVHGLAGPGGVLGIIPAVQLHDWKLATIYLASFCITSTLTMGFYASMYGMCSSTVARKTNFEFQIHCFSAALSLFVGILWLILLSIGKLDDVFP